ncbi:hypothetical protein JCM10212_004099 [Sporobolomyces blumeae]
MNTAHEIGVLTVAIKTHGRRDPATGHYEISYGELFHATERTLEALNGTLRAAKRQKKVTFPAELLMMPKDKDVVVTLVASDDDPDPSHGGLDLKSLP